MPPNADAGSLTLTCSPGHYSASAIAHAVEDADAHLLNLNVTAEKTDSGDMIVELRVSHRNTLSVARSLARYGFTVVNTDGTDSDNAAGDRPNPYAALIRYLEI